MAGPDIDDLDHVVPGGSLTGSSLVLGGISGCLSERMALMLSTTTQRRVSVSRG